MYNYFCDYCGLKFTSDQPYKDKDGFPSDVVCPKCGSHASAPDTPEERKRSADSLNEYENVQKLWEE